MINYFTGCRSYSRSSGRLSPSKLRDVIGVTRCDALGHVTQLRLRSRTGQVPATWNAQVSFTICRHRRLKVTAFYLRDTYLVFGIYQMLNVKGSQPVSSAYHIKLVLYRPVPSIWSSLKLLYWRSTWKGWEPLLLLINWFHNLLFKFVSRPEVMAEVASLTKDQIRMEMMEH